MNAQASFMEQLLDGLSAEENLVWQAIEKHRGKGQAITNAQLAHRIGLPERMVRWCLKSLTEDHHKPIGSLPGLGVFIVTSLEERQEVVDFYKSHALSLLKRMSVLSVFGTEHLIDQIKLELEHALNETEKRHATNT